MENVNFTIFFGGVCGFLVGFNRRPTDALGLRIWFSRHTCGVPGYYKSASCRRLPEGLASPETPDGDPVTINRRLSDACLMDGFALGLSVSLATP